jgi:hypothetical protein
VLRVGREKDKIIVQSVVDCDASQKYFNKANYNVKLYRPLDSVSSLCFETNGGQ